LNRSTIASERDCAPPDRVRVNSLVPATNLIVGDRSGPHLRAHSFAPLTKHGAKSRRKWRKLHLAVDAGSGMICAQTLTDQDADNPSQAAPLLNQIECRIARVTADGAYDGAPNLRHHCGARDDIQIVIPPRSTAVLSGEQGPLEQRDRNIEVITEKGRLAWQKATDYGQRSLVETTMGRYKALIGPRLRARGFAAQQTEAAIGVADLNRMLAAGRPDSVRCPRVTA
jgi:Transposase DDE domain